MPVSSPLEFLSRFALQPCACHARNYGVARFWASLSNQRERNAEDACGSQLNSAVFLLENLTTTSYCHG